MTYDLKIEENPNCKRISQYILNFCFSFDNYDNIKCERYQKLLKEKCTKENIFKIERDNDYNDTLLYNSF